MTPRTGSGQGHHPHEDRRAHVRRRAVAVLGSALLVTSSISIPPASAHYVQPPGEEEAAAAVVQVQVSYQYAVNLPGDGSDARPYEASVAGPRGTGAVVNPSGAVLTGRLTGMPGRGEQQALTAVNQAFRARHGLRWSEVQLTRRQRVSDEKINAQLQSCYANLDSCAVFQRRSRTVVFNTKPARRLEGRYSEINDGLAIVNTRFDRARTPTVGVSTAAPQPGGQYRAVGWGPERLLPAVAMTFENGAFREADLQKVGATFGNGGDGVVVVDSGSKGDVVAVVVRGEDGTPTTVSPLKPLQLGGVDVDRGALHPVVDQALGYFQGQHYTHALPLIQQVTRLIPDQGLLDKLRIAEEKAGGPEDKSSDSSPSMAGEDARSSSLWAVIAVAVGLVAVASAVAVLWSRGRRQRLGEGERADDDDFDLDELIDEGPAPQGHGDHDYAARRPVERVPSEHAEHLQPGAGAGPAPASQAESYCPQCGVSLLAVDRFCYHCGSPAR